MNETLPYRDGNAMWTAIKAHATTASRESGVPVATLMRQFTLDRFLARVFATQADEWVLKGGNAVLARVNNARTTKDLDLLAQINDLEGAADALSRVVATELNDHFRFIITSRRNSNTELITQPDVDGYRISVDAYCGVKLRYQFSVDLVTGSLMTVEPEMHIRSGLLPSIPPIKVRVYPVVDHIADKLCATQSMYGTAKDQPSSRVRDLVDLVVFARTQSVFAESLTAAINAEWIHRKLPSPVTFNPPKQWANLYSSLAKQVPACGDTLTFLAAVELVGQFLEPAITGADLDQCWSPELRVWQQN